MKTKHRVLLAVDAAVNLGLGAILLCFPTGLVGFLGLPPTDTFFYASLLGAVIFGIGVALAAELYGARHGVRGLGLGGAIAINLCGGGVLVFWLLVGHLQITIVGSIVLWCVATLVIGIGLAEIVTGSAKYS